MTDNEQAITQILEFLLASKAPTDKISVAMQRLLDQMPKPAAIDNRPDGERRMAFIEKMKEPATWTPPPPPPSDGELRREFLERQKQPHPLARQVT
jgi:hypothetical protein